MEEQKAMNNNGSKRTQISINGGGGGGGIGGLLVLGGALAVTGLIAVASFATKKNKAKNGGLKKLESESQEELDHSGSKNEDETAQELGSLLQNSTTNDETECCTTYETSKMLLSSQPLILEEKLDLKANVEEEISSCFAQEIVISGDSHPGSATSSNENGVGIEECLSDNPCLGKQKLDKNESETCLNEIEITEGENEDSTSKTEEDTEDDTKEDEDEDEEGMESDDVYENGEENSTEETVRSSLDSNEEPIWPAELIEQKQPPSKEASVNFLSPPKDLDEAAEEINHTENYAKSNDGNISDSAGDDRTVAQETMLMEKAGLFVVQKNQLSRFNPLKLTIRIIPMLLLMLLLVLVLLSHSSPESYHVVDPGSSAVTP